MENSRVFLDRARAQAGLRRFGLLGFPVRFDTVLPEGNSKRTILPVIILHDRRLRPMIIDKRFACEVNWPDIRIGTTVNLNRKRVLASDYDELAKVLRFVRARGPKRAVLDRFIGGSMVWPVIDLLVV